LGEKCDLQVAPNEISWQFPLNNFKTTLCPTTRHYTFNSFPCPRCAFSLLLLFLCFQFTKKPSHPSSLLTSLLDRYLFHSYPCAACFRTIYISFAKNTFSTCTPPQTLDYLFYLMNKIEQIETKHGPLGSAPPTPSLPSR